MGFFPARMTRLLVGGHKEHLAGAIETLHAEGAIHLEDYDDPTGTTSIGSPLPSGATVSEQLVKVRGLLKALGSEDVKPAGPVDAGHTLAQAEQSTAAIVDRANGHRADWVALESEEAALTPYRSLDIELSALTGLTSVKVYVGQARSDPTAALQSANVPAEVQAVPNGAGFAVAAIVPAKDAAAAEKTLQSSGFTSAALPQGRSGTPAQRLGAIAAEKARLQAALASSEADLARLRAEWAPRLASAERALSSEVEKTQAPLKFAVTQATFHLEGWIPRSASNRVKNALAAKFGDALYVEDLGDVPRHEDPASSRAGGGHGGAPASAHGLAADSHASVPPPGHAARRAVAGANGEHASGMPASHETDGHGGHHATGPADEPPVHLENSRLARPYEFLLGLLGKPRYNELDPTKLMLVFFPLFFGLMVGDLAVGLVIALVGLWMRKNHVFGIGGPAVGKVLVMGGLAAAVVGLFVFGEALGIHFVTPEPHDLEEEKELSWEGILGLDLGHEGFVHKSGGHEGALDHVDVEPAASNGTAELAGLTTHQAHAEPAGGGGLGALLKPHTGEHLVVGGVTLGLYSKIHDIQALLVWSVLIGVVHLNLGFILGIRNVYQAHGAKLAVQEKLAWVTFELGAVVAVWGLFGGPSFALPLGGGLAIASLALLWMGAAQVLGAGYVALLEVFGLVGNLLSYTRLAAIGASKAGIALAVVALADLATGGALNAGWWIIYVLGMAAITALAILSGGLQSLRLQYVEFFQKFYTGGGRPYLPFGRRAP